MKTERFSNIELLRLILMALIIYGHSIGQGIFDLNSISVYHTNMNEFLGALARVSVDCFVIISSYFYSKKEFRARDMMKKAVYIYFELAITILMVQSVAWIITKPNWEMMVLSVIDTFFPFSVYKVWFISVYMAFLLVLPMVKSATNKKYAFVVSCIYFISGTICPLITRNGYSNFFAELLTFIAIFYIISYLREFIDNLSINPLIYLAVFFAIYGFIIFYSIFSDSLKSDILRVYLLRLESIPCFTCALLIFLFFLKIKPIYSNAINNLSRGVMYAYIIHQCPLIIPCIWNDIFKVDIFAHRSVLTYLGYMLFVIMCILIVSYIWSLVMKKIEKYTIDNVNKRARSYFSGGVN